MNVILYSVLFSYEFVLLTVMMDASQFQLHKTHPITVSEMIMRLPPRQETISFIRGNYTLQLKIPI